MMENVDSTPHRMPVKRNDDAPRPAGIPVQLGNAVLLQHDDGTMYSMALMGGFVGNKNYPRMTSSPVRLTLEAVDSKSGGSLRSGDRIYIRTSEHQLAKDGSNYLGAWSTEALYYWSSGYDKEVFTVHKDGGGDIYYGDAVYFINEHYEQRVGRDSDTTYFTTDSSFTDTFTLLDPNALPVSSNFLPLDQNHTNGDQGDDPVLGYTWDKKAPRDQMFDVATNVPAGSYTVLIQLTHDSDVGEKIGTIFITVDGVLTVQQDVAAAKYDDGDWQRATVGVTLPKAAQLAVSFSAADNDDDLRTGCCTIAPAGQRPFYVIAHHRNSIAEMLQAAKDGANAIEFDISATLDDSGAIQYFVHHGFPNVDPWLPLGDYLQAIVHNNVLDTVAMLMFDIKPEPKIVTYNYGYYLAVIVSQFGIKANQAFLSVEDPSECAEFYRGVAAANFSGARDCSLIGSGLIPVTVDTDPSIWYRTGVVENGATFLGLGVAAGDVLSPMRSWLEVVSYANNMRDRAQLLKKTYFWTLDSDLSMNKMLDLGVDGIIVNDVATLLNVLANEPYASMYRLATSNDPLQVWGWPALGSAEPAAAVASAPAEPAAPRPQLAV